MTDQHVIATDQLLTSPMAALPCSRPASLRRWNLELGCFHATQAVAVVEAG
jgi:hypothetical protein